MPLRKSALSGDENMTDVKISVTTHCNSRCKTCPVWTIPGHDMLFDTFRTIFSKLVDDDRIKHILFSNTGEIFAMKDHNPMDFIRYAEKHKADKRVTMITNASEMYYVPVNLDKLIISFNGGTKEDYEYTTGLNFHNTVNVIRSYYRKFEKMKSVEMHCLIWKGNEGTEENFKNLWSDFPGKLRISYKVENQFGSDLSAKGQSRTKRIKCDYLDKINVAPNGKVIMCAHDFLLRTYFGDLLHGSIDETLEHPARLLKKEEHKKGIFKGLCRTCNYNTPVDERVVYVK